MSAASPTDAATVSDGSSLKTLVWHMKTLRELRGSLRPEDVLPATVPAPTVATASGNAGVETQIEEKKESINTLARTLASTMQALTVPDRSGVAVLEAEVKALNAAVAKDKAKTQAAQALLAIAKANSNINFTLTTEQVRSLINLKVAIDTNRTVANQTELLSHALSLLVFTAGQDVNFSKIITLASKCSDVIEETTSPELKAQIYRAAAAHVQDAIGLNANDLLDEAQAAEAIRQASLDIAEEKLGEQLAQAFYLKTEGQSGSSHFTSAEIDKAVTEARKALEEASRGMTKVNADAWEGKGKELIAEREALRQSYKDRFASIKEEVEARVADEETRKLLLRIALDTLAKDFESRKACPSQEDYLAQFLRVAQVNPTYHSIGNIDALEVDPNQYSAARLSGTVPLTDLGQWQNEIRLRQEQNQGHGIIVEAKEGMLRFWTRSEERDPRPSSGSLAASKLEKKSKELAKLKNGNLNIPKAILQGCPHDSDLNGLVIEACKKALLVTGNITWPQNPADKAAVTGSIGLSNVDKDLEPMMIEAIKQIMKEYPKITVGNLPAAKHEQASLYEALHGAEDGVAADRFKDGVPGKPMSNPAPSMAFGAQAMRPEPHDVAPYALAAH